MKKAARQIAALALALLIVCLLSRAAFRGGYTAYVPVPHSQKDLKPQSLRFELSSPGIVSPGVPQLQDAKLYQDDYAAARAFAEQALTGEAHGITGFCHADIFAAVYITNLLMRASDVLVTKPSELSFYPIPKLFIQHVGGHELWGAIHSAELGDGSYEVAPGRETVDMLRLFQTEREVLAKMNRCILENKKAGIYNGAYEVVRLACEG